LLWPFAWIMGTPLEDCRVVAELMGIKTFANEFIAYERLSGLIKNREAMLQWQLVSNHTASYNPIQNCYILSNGTYTASLEDCLPVISVCY